MPRKIVIEKGDIDLTRWAAKQFGFDNPIIGRTINVSGDSFYQGRFETVYAPFDYFLNDDIKWWNSESGTDHWYQIDLQSLNIYLTGFSIDVSTKHYMPNWKVIGTNDITTPQEKWKEIHTIQFPEQPKESYQFFKCDHPMSVRFIRLISSGVNFDGNSYLTVGSLHLFGTLLWVSCTAAIKTHIKLRFFTYIMLFVM